MLYWNDFETLFEGLVRNKRLLKQKNESVSAPAKSLICQAESRAEYDFSLQLSLLNLAVLFLGSL